MKKLSPKFSAFFYTLSTTFSLNYILLIVLIYPQALKAKEKLGHWPSYNAGYIPNLEYKNLLYLIMVIYVWSIILWTITSLVQCIFIKKTKLNYILLFIYAVFIIDALFGKTVDIIDWYFD